MEASLSETVATALKPHFRGQLIQPDDAAYDQARTVYNGMIDKRPALIARCVDVADVIASVNAARDRGLLLAVRGGAHNGAGLGTCDGGLVIDLSPMKGVFVDAARRTLRVSGGCTWAMSIMPPVPMAWQRPADSSRPPAWAD